MLEESLSYESSDQEMGARLSNLAVLYGDMGSKQCLVYARKAMHYQERAGDYRGLAISRLNLGDQYRKLEMFEEAAEELETGIVAVTRAGDRFWQGVGLMYAGWLFEDIRDEASAREALEQSLSIFKEIGATNQAKEVQTSLREMSREHEVQL